MDPQITSGVPLPDDVVHVVLDFLPWVAPAMLSLISKAARQWFRLKIIGYTVPSYASPSTASHHAHRDRFQAWLVSQVITRPSDFSGLKSFGIDICRPESIRTLASVVAINPPRLRRLAIHCSDATQVGPVVKSLAGLRRLKLNHLLIAFRWEKLKLPSMAHLTQMLESAPDTVEGLTLAFYSENRLTDEIHYELAPNTTIEQYWGQLMDCIVLCFPNLTSLAFFKVHFHATTHLKRLTKLERLDINFPSRDEMVMSYSEWANRYLPPSIPWENVIINLEARLLRELLAHGSDKVFAEVASHIRRLDLSHANISTTPSGASDVLRNHGLQHFVVNDYFPRLHRLEMKFQLAAHQVARTKDFFGILAVEDDDHIPLPKEDAPPTLQSVQLRLLQQYGLPFVEHCATADYERQWPQTRTLDDFRRYHWALVLQIDRKPTGSGKDLPINRLLLDAVFSANDTFPIDLYPLILSDSAPLIVHPAAVVVLLKRRPPTPEVATVLAAKLTAQVAATEGVQWLTKLVASSDSLLVIMFDSLVVSKNVLKLTFTQLKDFWARAVVAEPAKKTHWQAAMKQMLTTFTKRDYQLSPYSISEKAIASVFDFVPVVSPSATTPK